jgi:DNA-directed RNA polymerase specialized sigma subunit
VVRQRAQILAAQAVKGFMPEKGAQLTTHVYRQLQRLQREAPQLTDPMPMPERVRRDSRDVINAMAEIGAVAGTEISDEQVSELTGIPVSRVTKVRRLMRKGISESAYDEGLGEDDDDTPDVVAQSTEPYDEWVDAVYHDLGEVDRVVMAYRTGYRGNPVLSTTDIAKRLRMSPGAVSQRAAKIQAKLDEFYE